MELSKEQLEELIRKYQEEALQYQKKSTADLYQEEMPAQAVVAQPAEKFPPDDMEGIGDVYYSPEPLPLEEIVKESEFQPSTVPYDDTGKLQLNVTAGEQSLPVAFANVVIVREAEGEPELLQYLQTNISGSTPLIDLPAPARSLSEQPEPIGLLPYGVYTVAVSQKDYYTTIIKDVQIFAGQTAILPVTLLPLSEKAVNPSAPSRNIPTENHSLTE